MRKIFLLFIMLVFCLSFVNIVKSEGEPIIPVWYIFSPENEVIIDEKYFDIEVGYNLTDYLEYELAGFEFMIYKDDEFFKTIYMGTNVNRRVYLENGEYCYNVNMRLTEIENPENELNLDIGMFQGMNCLTINGSYEKPYIFYTEENIANGSEISNNTLRLYWNYNGTMDIWNNGFGTSIEIQKDLGEGYEFVDGVYFGDNQTTNTEINFGNYTGDYRFIMYLEVEDNESNFYGFYEDSQVLYYTLLGLPEPEVPPITGDIVSELNIQNRIMALITIMLVFSLAMFLYSTFGKKGMSKLSIYLIIFFALSLKVLAVEYDYARENALLNIITIFLILGILYFLYQKFFKEK